MERRLGMGLDALIGVGPNSQDASYVDIDLVRPSPYQPRLNFDGEDIKSLAESIKHNSMLLPVILRRNNGHYEIVAGERRVRAAKLAGLLKIPAIIKNVDDTAMLKLALVENIQRKDLNPLEKAEAFKRLSDEFNLSHEEIARELSIDRTTVTNFLRLLSLPEDVKNGIRSGEISAGHARALLSLDDPESQVSLYKDIKAQKLSVRKVEKKVRADKDYLMRDIESRLQEALGTKVEINSRRGKGTIKIEFYSVEQLNGLIDKLLNC